MAKAAAKAMTKSAIFAELSQKTELSKKQIGSVFDHLEALIIHQIGKKGPGVFTFPGVVKIVKKLRAASDARQGRNPQTGEPMMIKAKPARLVAKAYALKKIKEEVMKEKPAK